MQLHEASALVMEFYFNIQQYIITSEKIWCESVLDMVEADSFWCLSRLLDGIQVIPICLSAIFMIESSSKSF